MGSGDGMTQTVSAEEEEQIYLQKVISQIQDQLRRLESTPRYFPEESDEPQTADEVAQQAVDAMRDLRSAQLQAAKGEPFFGRIDFRERDEPSPAPLYIGKRGIEDDNSERLVIDWRAPAASLFYSFTGKGSNAAYDAPEGAVEGQVSLKRNILIRNSLLQRVVDSYVEGQDENLGITDEFLLYRLGEQKDSRLRDIVSTIQAEQDQIIRANRNQAVLIQGVAGSGKTTVALHRLAYLLYQNSERMRADRMAIFAPNRMFVDYISEVLPELGVGGIQQTTFAKWAVDALKNTVKLREPGRRLERWFDLVVSDKDKAVQRAATFKGSIAFRDLLDLQLNKLEQDWLPEEDFEPWDGVVLESAEIRAWFNKEYCNLAPFARRERVLARMKRWYETAYQRIKATDRSGSRKKLAASRFRAYRQRWTEVSTIVLFNAAWEQALQLGMPETGFIGKGKRPEVEVEDLGALVYLLLRLHGGGGVEPFHHVVIDEAQDFSPLQISVLRMCCPNDSFTILGDLAQSIHIHHGISDWSRFIDLFPDDKIAYYQLDVSYRSTMEIIDFANHILRAFPGSSAAKPVFRSGEPVTVTDVAGGSFDACAEVVREWKDVQSGAVVCRTAADAERYHQALSKAGIETHLIRSDQERYEGGISVLPIWSTKGLEFDAVLLVDVDDKRYPSTSEAAHLLYVGSTRALHRLTVHYTYRPSPLLPIS